MTEQVVASFDIGGTNMRAATVSVEGNATRIVEQSRRPTPNHLLAPGISARARLEDVLEFMSGYAHSARQRFNACAVSAAFPGPLDALGRIVALPTLWGSEGRHLCPLALDQLLVERLPGMRVRVFNDVTAAGYRFVPEYPDFALFTLGSGVGLKVFIDRKPQVGTHGRGGELTHMVFDSSPTAASCDCGGRGHLGALASGRAWQRRSVEAEREGRIADMHAFAEPLARAVAMLHLALGLETFIFSGGLTDGLGEPLRCAIVSRLPEQGWNTGQDWNSMILFAPDDDAHALLGGAMAVSSS